MLAAGLILPSSAPRAMEVDNAGLFGPTLECEPAGTRIDANLLARVRTSTATQKRRGSAASRHHNDRRDAARQAARPSSPRSERKPAPRRPEEARTAFIRSFYTCSAARSSALTEGTGWRLVGPLRQG